VERADSRDVELWDGLAERYAAQIDVDWFDGFLERHLGDVAGKRVLDLGCGHGWFTARLHECGADVVGVDGSERLLEVARQRYPEVQFEYRDFADGLEGTYDIVVALMVLMDLPKLASVRPRITNGGVLIATILHPAFFLQTTVDDDQGGYRMVRGYLDEEVWWVDTFGGHRHYHRPLGAYIDWAASLGLGVVELYEPSAASYQGWRSRIPTRLGFAARPVQRQST
jgi:SAM-dependent methyltransferase